MDADFKIVQDDVSMIVHHFTDIKEEMSISDGERSQIVIDRSNVGNSEVCKALDGYNGTFSDRKNKYDEKTQKYLEYLNTVNSSSDDLDYQLQAAIINGLNG